MYAVLWGGGMLALSGQDLRASHVCVRHKLDTLYLIDMILHSAQLSDAKKSVFERCSF